MPHKDGHITITIPTDAKALWTGFKSWIPGRGLIYVLLALAIAGWVYSFVESKRNANAERQLRGDLTQKEVELVSAKASIGQLQSTLLKQAKLEEAYKASILGKDKELEKLRKQYKLQVDSLTHVIATLQGHTTGGSSTVTPKPSGEVALDWWDPLKRFHLQTPNIFDPKSYAFTYSQLFSVDLVVFRQATKDGDLRVQSVQLNELNPSTGEVVQKATLDMSKSSFSFAPSLQDGSGPAQRFLLGISSFAEPMIAWEPYRVFKSSVGLSVMGFRSKTGDFVAGVGLNYYPQFSIFHSDLGFGISAGYSSSHKMEYRGQIVFSILSVGSR